MWKSRMEWDGHQWQVFLYTEDRCVVIPLDNWMQLEATTFAISEAQTGCEPQPQDHQQTAAGPAPG